MPRCGCQDACSCLLVAGPGVNVDGLGTVDRPYEISAESALLTENLFFDNSGNVDFSTSGTGVPTSPLRVSANAALKMTDLVDVQGTPTNGEVPVWVGDHWDFQTPGGGGGGGSISVTPPLSGDGTAGSPLGLDLTTGAGLLGEGTAGDPLRADTFAWGFSADAKPDLDRFGSDSTIGQPVYPDSTGKLRAQPLVITDTVGGSIAQAALPAAYPVGFSLMTLSGASATAGGWPSAGSVVTMRRMGDTDATSQANQWHYPAISGNQILPRFRTCAGNSWSAWVQVAGMYSNQAACPASFNLSATTVTDITGVSLTVPVAGPDSVYLVYLTVDIATIVATANTFLAMMNVGGVQSTQQVIWIPTTGVGPIARTQISQTYRYTGLPAGNQIFKAVAQCSTANQFRIASAHTNVTVQQIA